MSFLRGLAVPCATRMSHMEKLPSTSFGYKILILFTCILFLLNSNLLSQNAIVAENALPGNPASEWNIVGNADASIQGFATNLSVNKGETVNFKIKTDAASYSINIYRIGYYQGNGARFLKNININLSRAQVQPTDLYDSQTGKTDCSNWSVSASWAVPSSTVSGIYLAKLTKSNGGSNHIIFIVRDDNSTSDLLFKTSDATWQAYNNYGGNSLYNGTLYGTGTAIPVPGYSHATKVSYSRPFNNRNGSRDWFTDAEFPMIRYLEKNGYDVSYTTCENMAKDLTAILPSKRKVLLSVGHDEYWSLAERTKFENARNAGVHLAFFSGNEVYWKSRWEDDYKTLVCYKEGKTGELVCSAKCDPLDSVWTGLWRGGCEYTLADGCKPENALTGQMSWDEAAKAMEVPAEYKALRFWRNTTIASLAEGQTAKLSESTIGFEFDSEQYPESLPKGRMTMSRTNVNGKTHKLSLYKHSSGAWVFGAGTIQWSWGLDEVHTIGNGNPALQYLPDVRMQQATVNLFADMGVQPGKLQSNLVAATVSTDNTPPLSVLTTPNNYIFTLGTLATINGTASDVGGIVSVVEVSIDGGLTWKAAEGTSNWSYNYTPLSSGNINVKVRSFDDSGNEEPVVKGILVTVGQTPAPPECPCSLFISSDVPATVQNDRLSLETGVKFRASRNGLISGIKFYKGNIGATSYSGHLWTSTGTLLASADFAATTAVGWQEVSLPTPVNITAGTTYIVSVFSASGDYAFTRPYFNNGSIIKGPLTALGSGVEGANSVYIYSNTPAFPINAYLPTNYWIDAVFKDIETSPIVTKQPADVIICGQNPARFTASATGLPAPGIQWQVSTDKVTWINIANEQLETLSFIPGVTDNGKYYRAAFFNTTSIVYSAAAVLRVSNVSASVAAYTNTSCIGSDGSLTLNATGGFTPYMFSLDGGNFQASPVFNDLTARSYNINLRDAIGCSALLSVAVNSNPSLNLTLSSKSDASCIGNDGSITLTATGGTAPLTYSSDGINYQLSNVFSNLLAKSYAVTVKDAKGCISSSLPVVIAAYQPFNLSIASKSDASCIGNDASITLAAAGGTAPYTYKLNSGNFQTSNSFTALLPNSYNVTVRDATGCTATISGIVIVKVNSLTLQLLSKANVTCTDANGTIAVTAVGGVLPYSYSTNGTNFQNSSVFNGLLAGTYTITVKDGKGCTASITGVDIGVNNVLSLTLSGKTDATCGLTDGRITVTGSCGVPPYRYMLSTGIYQTTGTFSNLATGIFNVYIIDSKDNSAVVSGIVISEIKTLALTASKIVNENCTNGDGAVTLSAVGGESPYQYKVENGTYKTGNSFNNLTAGLYNFSIKDNNGCTTSTVITVGVAPSTLVMLVTETGDATCAGGDGYVKVNATGGSGGYMFNINGGVYGTGKTFRDLKEGIYIVSVKDSKGCITSLGGVELKRIIFTASLTGVTNVSCKGDDGIISINLVGGLAPYLYSINGGKYDNANRVIENVLPGKYNVVVKDALGCIAIINNVVVGKAPALTATVSLTNACKNINNGSITTIVTGGIAPYQYSLSGAGYKTSNIFSNLSPGSYYVRVKDARGCLFTLSGITITRLSTTCSGRGIEAYTTGSVKTKDVVLKEGIEEKATMSIFPNPSAGNFKLHIRGLNGNKAIIVIVDALGKEIYKAQTNISSDVNMLPINLDRIHKGTYFIKLSTNKFSMAEKLVIY